MFKFSCQIIPAIGFRTLLSSNGSFPNISTGSDQARIVYTQGTASPYQVAIGTTGLSKALNDSVHYYRRADIDLAYSGAHNQFFDGKFTLEMEAVYLTLNEKRQPINFIPIDSTVAFERMLDSQPFAIPSNADYVDFLFTIHTRDFSHPAAFSRDWLAPVVRLNLNDSNTDAELVTIQPIDFNRLIGFGKTNADTSFQVRLNVGALRGKRIRAKVQLLAQKKPFITQVYHFGASPALTKARGVIVYDETQMELLIPQAFSLSQNYPNPFNARTTIEYALPMKADVKIDVYNIVGEKVCTLVDEEQYSGYHKIAWDANAYSSGIYYLRFSTRQFSSVKKMVLIK